MSYLGRADSIRGDSHIERGLPVQDASSHVETNHYAMAVVADGHGGEKYIRSNIGSEIAVRSAIDTAEKYMADWDNFLERVNEDPDEVLTSLCNSIIANWHKGIEDYNDANPLRGAEVDFLSELSRKGKGIKEWETMYGTTLVMVVISDEFTYGVQIGDGNLVIVDESGDVFMPMPDDENCVGNRTTSLCNPKASEYIRYYFGRPSVAALVCTDGFETSFVSNDSFMRQCWSVIDMMKGDVNAAWYKIRGDMEQRSKCNNRDDVSVSIVFKRSVDLRRMQQSSDTNQCSQKKNHRFTDKTKMRGHKKR